jgi:hypothetical protein
VWLEVIYDFQAINSKQRGFLQDPPPFLPAHSYFLFVYESHKPPGLPEYTKHHHKLVDAIIFGLKNCLKQHFFDENL